MRGLVNSRASSRVVWRFSSRPTCFTTGASWPRCLHSWASTRRLHQAVLECLAANESTYKFKPSVALKRHQSLNELDVQDDDVALADASEQVPANDPAENAVAVAVN